MRAEIDVPAGSTAGANAKTERALDDAPMNTFPASDPVAISEPAGAVPERPVIEPGDRARGGETGHNVRYVLGWGLAGIVVAFTIVYISFHA